MSTKLIFGGLLLLATIFSVILWIFEPTIHYFDSVNVNTMDRRDFTMDDRQIKRDIDLSVVIPAYNEEMRLPIMLDSSIEYLNKWSTQNNAAYEIIVVDDGSTDSTSTVVEKYAKGRVDRIRLLRLHNNRGKGAALKMGVRESIGNMILIADADGATEISDLNRLIPALYEVSSKVEQDDTENNLALSLGMVVGSRAHLAKNSIATRAFYRTVLMKGFHWYVQLLVTANVEDTQCGFKLLTHRAAKTLFGSLHLYRWAFDTELIFLAEWLHIPIAEVSVNWHEVDGSKLIRSKLDVVTTSITMARDILCMRLSYLLGLWETPFILDKYHSNPSIDTRFEL